MRDFSSSSKTPGRSSYCVPHLEGTQSSRAEGTGREEEVKEERRKGRKDGKTEGKEGKKEREKALGFLAIYSASKTQTFSEAE